MARAKIALALLFAAVGTTNSLCSRLGMCRIGGRLTMGLATGTSSTVSELLSRMEQSVTKELQPDPQSGTLYPNRESRECFGHYVECEPSPLAQPYLVAASNEMLAEVGLDPMVTSTPSFVRLFSGDLSEARIRAIATPYAVSVFGSPIWAPDPFGRGNGYGDGRAQGLGEVVCDNGNRWELQLKGGGTTPFSRGGDGRAVLRSSIREYLVSEAMHHLGIPTTRALCLVASQSQRVRRMWYGKSDRGRRDHPPDTMVTERCAITCRAAPSFLRVGHLELHARRAARGSSRDGEHDPEPTAAKARAMLLSLFQSAVRREFAGEVDLAAPLEDQCLAMLRAFARRQAELTAGWLRVGYVQGNMNSDNNLLSGRTMDYGPFGFVEQYELLWSPFTSDAERKFGFERQPLAAQVNVMTLARALLPLIASGEDANGKMVVDDAVAEKLQAVVSDEYKVMSAAAQGEARRAKMGLATWDEQASTELFDELQQLMARSRLDFTIFWRQLSHVTDVDLRAAAAGQPAGATAKLAPAFYEANMLQAAEGEWAAWLAKYAARLQSEARPEEERQAQMRAASPKYVPREWMLVKAYEAADNGDLSVLRELEELFRHPYDEQPQLEHKYYTRTPDEYRQKAGVAYFS